MFLYVVYNESSGRYYIGVTSNLNRRLLEHNRKNGHFTGKTVGTWSIKFSRKYETREEALREERRLKKAKNKKYLEWYINNTGL